MSEEMPPREPANEENQPHESINEQMSTSESSIEPDHEALSEEILSQEPKVEETSIPETPVQEQPVIKEPPNKYKRVFITIIVIESILILGLLLIIFSLSILLLQAAETAKLSAVKADFSAAYTTVALKTLEGMSAREAAKEAIYDLNTGFTPDDESDDAYSPFDQSLSAFDSKRGPGVVVIEATDSKTIVITSYDKEQKPLESKKVNISDDEQSTGSTEETQANPEEETQDMESNEEEQPENPFGDRQDTEDREEE